MKSIISILWAILLVFMLLPENGPAQSSPEIIMQVDDLVGKHYMDGVPYAQAHDLGAQALPYLFELLADPDQKLFWVNIIVAIGFIEDSSAVNPLVAFLEAPEEEVDGFNFRALLSIPYALGCIASNGSPDAIGFLAEKATGQKGFPLRWTFRGKQIDQLIEEQSVMALAVSGRPEARQVLRNLQSVMAKTGDETSSKARKRSFVSQGLDLMNSIDTKGRARVLNPQREE